MFIKTWKKKTFVKVVRKSTMVLVDTKKFEDFSKQVFKLNVNIKYFALIDLEGHIIIENSKSSTSVGETDADRIMFYHQIGTRRTKREDFDDVFGETSYIHIQRKKIQQLIVYLPATTIYLMIDNKTKPDKMINLVHGLQNIDTQTLIMC